MLTVGTLSVSKDTQGPAGFPPVSSLPRQCTCAQASGATSVCQEQILSVKGDTIKPQLNAQKLLKTYDINKCDLSIQEVPDAVLGAEDTVENKTDVTSALLKLTVGGGGGGRVVESRTLSRLLCVFPMAIVFSFVNINV